MKPIFLFKKSSIILVLMGMAAFMPSRGQTTDSYTATGSGITTGAWDNAANWSTGAIPTSSVDAQLTNGSSSANSAAVTLTMGTDAANSLWFLQTLPLRNTSSTSWGYTLTGGALTIGSAGNTSHQITVNGTTFNWGIVNGETFANTYNVETFVTPVTFADPNTAIGGNVTFNGTVAGTGIFLQTSNPSNFGGSPNTNPIFTEATVVFGSSAMISGFTTLEATTYGGSNGGGNGGITFNGPPSGVTGTPNIILAGGKLSLANGNPYAFGNLTLDAGLDLVLGGSRGTTFTGLTIQTGAALVTDSGEAVIAGKTGSGIGTANSNNVNGIVGGWSAVTGAWGDWATYNGSGAMTSLAGLSSAQGGYTYDDNVNGTSASGSGVFAGAWTSTMNIDFGNTVTSSGVINSPTISDSLAGNTTINSLRFGVASSIASSTTFLGSASLDVKGSVLTIGTGGILEAPGSGGSGFLGDIIYDSTATSTTTGTGGITAGSGNQLYLWGIQNDGGTVAAPKFTIAATIEDNGSPVSLVVADNDNGASIVNLTGTNTYTGNTYLDGGVAIIHSSAGLGAAGNQLVFGGGALDVQGATIGGTAFDHPIVVDAGGGGTIQVEEIGQHISGGALGGVPQAGTGLVLGAASISGSGPLIFQAGNVVGVSTGASLLELTGTNTLTGPMIFGGGSTTITAANTLDVYLDNTNGNAINSDVYLLGGNNGADLVWLANNQMADTAVLNMSPTNSHSYVAFLNGFSDVIGGLVETDATGVDEFENGSTTSASTLTLDNQFRSDVNGGFYYFTGLLTNGGSQVLNLVKTGPAIQVLSGTNNYTGTTSVTSGTLMVNGTNENGGNYAITGGSDVQSLPATLGGYGSIVMASSTNTFTVSGTDPSHPGIIYPGPNGSATLTAGVGGAPAGTTDILTAGTPVPGQQNIDLTVGSGGAEGVNGISTTVNFGANSELKLDLGSNGLSSQLFVYGNINIANTLTTLSLNIVPGSVISGTYVLAITDQGFNGLLPTGPNDTVFSTGDALGSITGEFANVVGLPEGYQIDYMTDPGEILLDAAIPEPSVMAMMVGALGMLAFVIRRRNKMNDVRIAPE